jgi:hypothetical protein
MSRTRATEKAIVGLLRSVILWLFDGGSQNLLPSWQIAYRGKPCPIILRGQTNRLQRQRYDAWLLWLVDHVTNNNPHQQLSTLLLTTPLHYQRLSNMADSDVLPAPAQLEAQLGKCKSVRPATYYKTRVKTAAVGFLLARRSVCCLACHLILTLTSNLLYFPTTRK